MGLKAEQIEKSFQGIPGRKQLKKAQHRKQRRRMKQDLEYSPQYNRYDGWEY